MHWSIHISYIGKSVWIPLLENRDQYHETSHDYNNSAAGMRLQESKQNAHAAGDISVRFNEFRNEIFPRDHKSDISVIDWHMIKIRTGNQINHTIWHMYICHKTAQSAPRLCLNEPRYINAFIPFEALSLRGWHVLLRVTCLPSQTKALPVNPFVIMHSVLWVCLRGYLATIVPKVLTTDATYLTPSFFCEIETLLTVFICRGRGVCDIGYNTPHTPPYFEESIQHITELITNIDMDKTLWKLMIAR